MKKLLTLLTAMAITFTFATAEGKCGEGKCGDATKAEKKCDAAKADKKCDAAKADKKCNAGKADDSKKETAEKK